MNVEYKAFDGSIRTLGDNELQHWKYIKKIPAGSGFRYFYSWDEYRAYLADPTAELKKAGSQVSKQIQSTTRRGSQEVRSTGRSVQKYVTRGRNNVKKSINSKITVSGVKQTNASRSPGFRQRMNEIAKRASEKWNSNKEAVKQSIEKGTKWFNNHLNPIAAIKRYKKEREEKEAAERRAFEEKLPDLAKKYKYISKKTINGKVRYFYSEDELRAYEKKQNYITNEPAFMSSVKKSQEPYTREEDAMLVNPNLDSWDSNYSVNCAECSAIYELRRRGYDVESNGESGNGPNAEIYNTEKRFDVFYKDADIHHIEPASSDDEYYKQLQREFDQYPPGSRGDISFKWKGSRSGHSINWEKDGDGNIHFVDTQQSGSGNQVEYDVKGLASCIDHTYTEKRRVKGKFFKQDVGFTTVTRTDNLELQKDITKICQNSSDKRPAVNTKNPKRYVANNGSLYEQHDFTGYGAMSEKDAVTKYPNLLDSKSYNDTYKPSGKRSDRHIDEYRREQGYDR